MTVAASELLRVPCDLDLAEAEDRDEAEQLYLEQATALRDAGADVVMTERAGSHGDEFWRTEFSLMVAWAFAR